MLFWRQSSLSVASYPAIFYDTIEKLLKVLLQCSFTVLVSFKTTATGISVYVKGLSNV